MTAQPSGVDEFARLIGECTAEQLSELNLPATPRTTSDQPERAPESGDELAGIAGISGERGRGTLLLRTSAGVLGRGQPAQGETGADAYEQMRALAEKLFDRIRIRCQERGLKLELTAPRIIGSSRLRTKTLPGAASRTLEYVCEAGEIGVGVDFVVQGDAALFEDRHILVVDDSPAIRQELRACLEANGYRVYEAGDGADGLRMIREHENLAMVLCDVNMPGTDGLELVTRVKGDERYAALPIVMLTSEVRARVCSQALKQGAVGWLVKPFNPAQLLVTVNKLARR
jgi:two-component system chemotaxis response regulator CheY